ncbi:MAG: hypothetical protein AMXMBFR84_41790 [Candidatus Hydrogenedentota bacterium]
MLSGEALDSLRAIAGEQVEFFPHAFQEHLIGLLPKVGTRVVQAAKPNCAQGASTAAFESASRFDSSPLSALGWYRCGEDGRLYLTTKSEHYHASLGHGFPGYRLLDRARRLGIPNATHNNTRGHITRTLEEDLVLVANGHAPTDRRALPDLLRSRERGILNRVLNLETGSLAVEAGLKMMLARFYRMESDQAEPLYAGKTPVFLVLGDDEGNCNGNYHGTTVLTQTFRGKWPRIREQLEKVGTFRIHAIRPNRMEDLESAFSRCETETTRIAGLLHEIVMMNYGGVQLKKPFLSRAYELCHLHNVPVMADEIQTCVWGPGLFLYKSYGLCPDMVAVGKGFPGGEFASSRILFSAALEGDLPQFGSLVTNGQEELASLAYLVTMRWALANTRVTQNIGDEYANRLRELAKQHDDVIAGVEGWGHLSSLFLYDLNVARQLAAMLIQKGLDISAQTYKADCPPALLTKLPLIASREVVDVVLRKVSEALTEVKANGEVTIAQ